MSKEVTRRDFVKETLVASAGATLVMNAAMGQTPAAAPVTPADTLPKGKIGGTEFSRLMLGGNLISGYSHSRDLRYVSALMRHYNTEAKILETLALAEQHGIDSVNTAVWDDNTALVKHLKQGGKMKWVVAANPVDDNLEQAKKAIDQGADIVYVQGEFADRAVKAGKVEVIAKQTEYVRMQGIPTGVGAHLAGTILACEEAKVNPDFYQKTFHSLDYRSAPQDGETGEVGTWDNSWCNDPQKVIDLMAKIEKPWVAFKVMAAGAIPPRKGFQFAFESGADFVLAGMFDFQIAEDALAAKEVLADVKRTRPWRS